MFGTLRKHTNNPNAATHVRPRGHNAPSDTARHADAATRAPRDTPPLLLAEAGALVAFTERDRETKDAQRSGAAEMSALAPASGRPGAASSDLSNDARAATGSGGSGTSAYQTAIGPIKQAVI